MSFFDFNRAIIRHASQRVADGLRAVDMGSPSFEGVQSEQYAYIAALKAAGVTVIELLPLERFPDSLFVEDTALVFSGAAILLNPGAPTRRGEAAEIAPVLEQQFRHVLKLEEGSADGGDILTTPRGVFIGVSQRTSPQGARALMSLLNKIGMHGRAVSTPAGVLHLKSDCALLDEETVLCTPRLAASDVFDGFRTILTPPGEEAAANAVRIGDRVLVSRGYPRTAELLEDAGLAIIPLATDEIGKIDAGLSCMSLRWRA
ncbi:dimethylarginine dimethylaminohydrolase family protein [Terricaulis sp.]|uniref:dimethylarginine dimethylaminohydrolase family protein n=1 Tax=Terricaulis sp. TaxID=2768686 RepID=UPI003783FBB2